MNSLNSGNSSLSVVILGATGAVGGHALRTLIASEQVNRITSLGRSTIPAISNSSVQQKEIDIFNPASYRKLLTEHSSAICTLGVGQPSKISKEDFTKIDKLAVINFAKECKKAGILHFQLLASVGIDPKSASFYLRTKGELVEELKTLHFERLSIFKPSMILTPKNRYGIAQAINLKLWPLLKPLLRGSLRKYRGIPVHILGEAIAKNIFTNGKTFEIIEWDEFYSIIKEN